MKARTVVIVGGGVIGLSTAYHLARLNYGRIVVLEKSRLGDGASRRAAGITTGLLWTETGVRARQVGLRLFRELGRVLPGYAFHDGQGCLNLFSPELWAARAALLPLYDRVGVPYQVLSGEEINRRWPALRARAEWVGLHDPAGGYSEPEEYVRALAQAAADRGVELREQEKVVGWVRDGQAVAGVTTQRQTFLADAVVVTVHAWTLPVLAPLGVEPPVKHFVHQRYLSTPLSTPLALPPINADPYGGYVRPAAGNRILLGVETPDRAEWRVESGDFDMAELWAPGDLTRMAAARFQALVPVLATAEWESEQVGLISFSMDGEPVLGPVAAVPRLFLGQAFHSGGFSYNPVAGMLLAEFVVAGKTSLDVSSFSPDRFDGLAATAHLKSVVAQRHAVARRH